MTECRSWAMGPVQGGSKLQGTGPVRLLAVIQSSIRASTQPCSFQKTGLT
ncbi:hypothetical protein [Streptomyces sp. NPDC001404]